MPYNDSFILVASAIFAAVVLQGCGNPPSPTPSPPSPSPARSLNPIEVKGQHLFDSVTAEPFFAVGIAFPDQLPNDPKEWISVLQRIGKEGKNINMVRLYEVPQCIWDDVYGSCFHDFMEEAAKLGIYVLFPGTGSSSGYVPRTGWTTAQQCYELGKPLNFGRGIVQRFANYPNTLAIVIGNEFFMTDLVDTFKAANVFKAYARDLKAYMKMCSDDPQSPSNGVMRQIPIMYAARDLGNNIIKQEMSFFKCGSADISIDIYGLNIERWCDPQATDAYDALHTMVANVSLPGTFMFSEMGCPQSLVRSAPPGQTCRISPIGQRFWLCPRNWNQIPDLFEKFKMFDGFSAYAYWNSGASNFNMLDSKWGNATIYFDGQNFFNQTDAIKKAERSMTEVQHPTCAAQLNGVPVLPLEDIKAYDQDKYPASQCPSPKHHAALPRPVAYV